MMRIQPMKMAVATEATAGTTIATIPRTLARTPAIISRRRPRRNASTSSSLLAGAAMPV